MKALLKKYQTPVLVLAIAILLFIGFLKVREGLLSRALDEPASSLRCEFVGKIKPDEAITRDKLKVEIITVSGRSYVTDNYDIDQKNAPRNGSAFDLTVKAQGLETVVYVPITRTKSVDYEIGFPNQEDVIATIYTNGDLEFSGSGSTLSFADGDAPWEEENYNYVMFGEDVAPQNIDYWFKDNEALTFVGPLPTSIESMKDTFFNCKALKQTPEMFQCESLRVMKNAFSGCEQLRESDAIPMATVDMEGAFENCSSLIEPPDLSKAVRLIILNQTFVGCSNMIEPPDIPDSVVDMQETFSDCTNIREAALFPQSVENIRAVYRNCVNLEKPADIPSSVKDCSSCYEKCENLCGKLNIDTDTAQNDSMLSGAAISGRALSLGGSSGRLTELVQDAENRYVKLADADAAAAQAKALEEKEAFQ